MRAERDPLAAALREEKKARKADATDAELRVNAAGNAGTAAVREAKAAERAERVRLAAERDAAAASAAASLERVATLEQSLERVRTCSKAQLLGELERERARVKELSARRKAGQMTIKQANLWKHHHEVRHASLMYH